MMSIRTAHTELGKNRTGRAFEFGGLLVYCKGPCTGVFGETDVLRIKIGLSLGSLPLPFRKALAKAAELGAEAVEIDARSHIRPQELTETGLRQIRKMLEDYNLRVCAVSFLTRRGYNVADQLDRRLEATKQAMSMAYKLGARVVVNQVGHIPSEPSGNEWLTLIESLTDLGRHGQHVGATLAARTGAESGEALKRLIDALPEGSLGVDFDPGSLIVNGFSPPEALAALGPHVVHVHAKDATRDLAKRRGLETPLGRGTADFPELLGLLEQHEYRGYFTVERENAKDPVGELGQAIKYLRNLAS
jgi:sugar phosphate isomerase/epimerase